MNEDLYEKDTVIYRKHHNFFAGLMIGLQYKRTTLLESNLKQIMNIGFSNSLICEKNIEEKGMEFYEDFLQGKRKAISENMGEIGITDITIPKGEPEKYYSSKYVYFDSDKDGLKELHVKSARYYYIIKYENGNLMIWKQLSPDWEPLDNGAFLEERIFSAPTYTVYSYSVVDCNGNDAFEINFGTYDSKCLKITKLGKGRKIIDYLLQ